MFCYKTLDLIYSFYSNSLSLTLVLLGKEESTSLLMPDRGGLCGHPGSVDTWSEGSLFHWMSGTFSSAVISTDTTVEMALLLLVDGESPHTSLDFF